jgi:hypothetical protein
LRTFLHFLHLLQQYCVTRSIGPRQSCALGPAEAGKIGSIGLMRLVPLVVVSDLPADMQPVKRIAGFEDLFPGDRHPRRHKQTVEVRHRHIRSGTQEMVGIVNAGVSEGDSPEMTDDPCVGPTSSGGWRGGREDAREGRLLRSQNQVGIVAAKRSIAALAVPHCVSPQTASLRNRLTAASHEGPRASAS